MSKFSWLPDEVLTKTLMLLPQRSLVRFQSTFRIPQSCYFYLFEAYLFKKLNINSWRTAFNILLQGRLYTEREVTIHRMYATFSAAFKYSNYHMDIDFPLFHRDGNKSPDVIKMFHQNHPNERLLYPDGRLGFEYASESTWKWNDMEYDGQDEEGYENDVFIFDDLYIDLEVDDEDNSSIDKQNLGSAVAICDHEMVQSKLNDPRHYRLVTVSLRF